MKKLLFIFCLLIAENVFAQEITFKLNKDVVVKGGNIDSPEIYLEKDTLITVNNDNVFYINTLNEKKFYSIQGHVNNYKLRFNANDLLYKDYPNFEIEEINCLWCMSYYYDALKNNNHAIINNNDVITQADRENTFLFQPLYFMLGNNFIAGQSSALLGDFNAISRIESKSDDEIIFVIIFNDCGIKESEETFRWDKHYKRLYESKTPYKVIFRINGDFADVYINSVSKSNFLFTLARTDEKTLEQITSFVKTGSFDSSKIRWPKQGTSTSTKTVSTPSTNVAPNKTMTTNCNLKLRSGEATSTQVLTVMSAGTKVKILELGKAETIDGINSNWVKVEVQKGAKDRDGKSIKAGTVGWCYGGYLE